MRFFYRWLLWLGVGSFTWGAEAYDDGESKSDGQSSVVRSEKSVDEAKHQAAFNIALRGRAAEVDRRSEGGGSGLHNGVDATTRGIRDDEGFIGEVAAPQVEKGVTPLMESIVAFREGDDPASIVEELQKAKEAGTINQQSQPSGRTALMDLVERVPEDVLLGAPGGGEPRLLQCFLDARADPYGEDTQGQSAFLIAVRARKYETALRFLDTNATVPDSQLEMMINLILLKEKIFQHSQYQDTLLNCMIDKIKKMTHLETWEYFVKGAVMTNNKRLVEKILIRFIVLCLGGGSSLAKDIVLLPKEDFKKKYGDYERYTTFLLPI